MEYSPEELREIRKRGRSATRLYILTSALIPVGFAVAGYGLLAATTHAQTVLCLVGAATLVTPGLLVAMFAWCSPACRFPLPQGWFPRYCYRCKAPLR